MAHAVAQAAVHSAVSAAVRAVVHHHEPPCKRRRRDTSLMDSDAACRRLFGCHRRSFFVVCELVNRHWLETHTAVTDVQTRVELTLFYLTHGDLQQAAQALQVPPETAITSVWQVLDVLLLDSVKRTLFQLPQSDEQWSQLSDAFERVCGFPGCCLAVGGLLVEIQRPRQWEGWYCSKNFPAENVQLVVDAQCRVRAMDVRPGGITDRETLRYSRFGRSLADILPEGKHIVGHSGYPLSKQVIVPYPDSSSISAGQKLFNELQATTQRVVKRVGEMIKKRFRILQAPLNQRTEDGDAATTRMAQVISAAIVLHNIFVDLDDLIEVDSGLGDATDEEDMEDDSELEDSDMDMDESMEDEAEAHRDRIKDYLYANREHIRMRFG